MNHKPQPNTRTARARLSGDRIAKLVNAAIAGDQGAWHRLVEEFGSMIWAIARAHRLGDADAADVSQATWAALVQNLRQINDPTRVGAWLATTARRECIRVFREGERRVLFGGEAPDQQSLEPQPGDALLSSERDKALWRGFSRLRPSDQALLRLVVTADPPPTYEEIAAALDIPIGSIGPTRQRALRRLREQLAGQQTLDLVSE